MLNRFNKFQAALVLYPFIHKVSIASSSSPVLECQVSVTQSSSSGSSPSATGSTARTTSGTTPSGTSPSGTGSTVPLHLGTSPSGTGSTATVPIWHCTIWNYTIWHRVNSHHHLALHHLVLVPQLLHHLGTIWHGFNATTPYYSVWHESIWNYTPSGTTTIWHAFHELLAHLGTTPPSGTTPSGTTPSGTGSTATTPSGTSPSGTGSTATTPSGSTPSGTGSTATGPSGTGSRATTPYGTTPSGTGSHSYYSVWHYSIWHGFHSYYSVWHYSIWHGFHSYYSIGTSPSGTGSTATTPSGTTPSGTTTSGTGSTTLVPSGSGPSRIWISPLYHTIGLIRSYGGISLSLSASPKGEVTFSHTQILVRFTLQTLILTVVLFLVYNVELNPQGSVNNGEINLDNGSTYVIVEPVSEVVRSTSSLVTCITPSDTFYWSTVVFNCDGPSPVDPTESNSTPIPVVGYAEKPTVLLPSVLDTPVLALTSLKELLQVPMLYYRNYGGAIASSATSSSHTCHSRFVFFYLCYRSSQVTSISAQAISRSEFWPSLSLKASSGTSVTTESNSVTVPVTATSPRPSRLTLQH
ncbi:ABH_G0017880.mRNA.1.CDS.1 [Saccharomyces cerevisiae]|nr:ABH_G0017880.mRNA.1.CDS.1 [Saccharomyces cerevisiae]CAI6613706.1 ABH_G0017880.mRNA.1.CDS.1 [Saccharomyces cerevisiae]